MRIVLGVFLLLVILVAGAVTVLLATVAALPAVALGLVVMPWLMPVLRFLLRRREPEAPTRSATGREDDGLRGIGRAGIAPAR